MLRIKDIGPYPTTATKRDKAKINMKIYVFNFVDKLFHDKNMEFDVSKDKLKDIVEEVVIGHTYLGGK